MGGLCGAVAVDAAVDPELVARMAACTPFRGEPVTADLQGRFLAAALGADASIAQLGSVVAVSHSRLDNRSELQDLLGGQHRSEAALVCAAYHRWGEGFAAHLLGDFAVVVYDGERGTLLAARDPFAMRPLHLHRSGRTLRFASEAVQLVAAGASVEPDEVVVGAFLSGTMGLLDRSFLRDVAVVPPSHTAVWRGGALRTTRHWDVDPTRRVLHRDLRDYAEHLRDLLITSMRARMPADSPLGVLLSGGVDSTTAASLAGWLHEQGQPAAGLRSYSWRFDELVDCDERHISRHVVGRYDIEAVEVPADHRGPFAGFPAHAPDPDDPLHGAFQPLVDSVLADAQDAGVRHLMSGMRGDLVAGPTQRWYLDLLRAGDARALLTLLLEHRTHAGSPFPGLLRQQVVGPALQRLRSGAARRWLQRRRDARTPSAPVRPPWPSWIRAGFAERIRLAEVMATHADADAPPMHPLRQDRYRAVFIPMHMRSGAATERRYARYGIAPVDPYSDRRIAEFAVAVPPSLLGPTEPPKRLLREAMRGIVPDPVRANAAKILPTRLFHRGLREGAAHVRWLLDGALVEEAGWVDAAALLDSYERWLRGGRLAPELWWALSTEWWLRSRSTP